MEALKTFEVRIYMINVYIGYIHISFFIYLFIFLVYGFFITFFFILNFSRVMTIFFVLLNLPHLLTQPHSPRSAVHYNAVPFNNVDLRFLK